MHTIIQVDKPNLGFYSLIKEAFYNSKNYKIFLAVHIFGLIVGVFKWMIFSTFSKTLNYLWLFIILNLAYTQIIKYNDIYTLKVDTDIYNTFIKRAVSLYDRMKWSDKNLNAYSSYKRKMLDASRAIEILFNWGIPTILSLVQNVISCILISIRQESYLIPFTLTFVSLSLYYFTIKNKQMEFRKFRKDKWKEIDSQRDFINNMTPRFQLGDIDSNRLGNMYSNKRTNTNEISIGWNSINNTIRLALDIDFVVIIFILVYSNTSSGDFLIILAILSNFTNTFRSTIYFTDKFIKIIDEYNKWEKVFDNIELRSYFPPQKELPIDPNTGKWLLKIESVEIIRTSSNKTDSFRLKSNLKTSYEIKQGDKIWIKGKSGAGKSSFLNALRSNLPGIKLTDYKEIESYKDSITFVQQEIGKIGTNNTSVKDLFVFPGEELNMKIFRKVCSICCIQKWVNKTYGTDLNEHIKEQISGGQKTRLLLATKIYDHIVNKRKIIIFDEPEKGLDDETAFQIVHNIYTELSEDCIFIVSHRDLQTLNISGEKIYIPEWKTINIRDGIINF